MKKIFSLLITLLLIVALLFVFTACDLGVIDDPSDNGNKDNEDDKDKDEEDEEDDPPVNPYLDIINAIMANIGDLESMADYVNALNFLLNNANLNEVFNLKEKAKDLIPAEYQDIVDTYFDKGVAMLELASTVLPYMEFLPQIMNLLPLIADYGNSIPPILLVPFGITKNGEVYSFTREETTYYVTVDKDDELNQYLCNISFDEQSYDITMQELEEEKYLCTVSFDETTLDIEIVDQNNINVKQNNTLYELAFNEDDQSMMFNMIDITDTENPVDKYIFESVKVDDDFAFQFFDKEGASLVQMITQIQMLEATLSIQEEINELPYSILENVPQSFATLGEIYVVNEGLLDEYLPNNA